MADNKDKIKLPVNVDVGAKAEAKLEVKTEIPPESSGRFVDAITDAIRPFTEQRGLKADLIRLQREDVALEIAKRAHERANLEKLVIQPVPNKTLVPLLEKGSLEESDSPLIDWWANLLVSAADPNVQTRPFFNDLINKISPNEARLLEMLWERFRLRRDYNSDERLVRIWITDFLQQLVTDAIEATPNEKKSEVWREAVAKKFIEAAREYVTMMDDGGVVISDLRLPSGEETMFFSSEIYRVQPTSFQVCRALEILHDYEFTLGFSQWGMVGRVYSAKATFFTSLGCEFMNATHRQPN